MTETDTCIWVCSSCILICQTPKVYNLRQNIDVIWFKQMFMLYTIQQQHFHHILHPNRHRGKIASPKPESNVLILVFAALSVTSCDLIYQYFPV